MNNLTLALSRSSKEPMYEQLYRYFVGEISGGRLVSGEKLPSKRAMCEHLGISRTTIETAYSILVAEGYVISREKSGYYVSDFLPYSGVCEPPKAASSKIPSVPEARPRFDFSTSSVDTSLFPYPSWAKLNREVVYSSPELLQRGDRQGDLPLREALCAFLSEYRGVSCTPEQIVVGAGMEYLTEVLMQLFPRSTVFGIEDPGYASIYHTLCNSGRQLRFISLDKNGMSVDSLDESCVDVAYITPSHQFPLGITMPASRRSHILRWAEKKDGRYIIEDDYDSEFRYDSRPVAAMQGMDRDGRVIYIGTFSRSIAPSIRVAYMVLPPLLSERYSSLFSHSLSTVSRFEQAVMARFISEGFYARYLRRLGSLYRSRREKLLDELGGIPGVEISGADGGLHFLLTLPALTEIELISRAAAVGIKLAALSSYCRESTPKPSTVVLGFGGIDTEHIPEAVDVLRRAWKP